jgi:hypothetical protein
MHSLLWLAATDLRILRKEDKRKVYPRFESYPLHMLQQSSQDKDFAWQRFEKVALFCFLNWEFNGHIGSSEL